MLKILLKNGIKSLMATNKEQTKRAIAKKRKEKERRRKYMVNTFGKLRCCLAWWVGDWVLYTFNRRFYERPISEEYSKYYPNRQIAEKYARMQEKQYEKVEIVPVYTKHKNIAGYILSAENKKAADALQQPSKVIQLKHYINSMSR